MQRKSIVTQIMAVLGTILAWLPILAPVLLSAMGLFSGRMFRFDYLMPAELFPVALIGAGLLLWASLRARSRRRFIAWGLALMVGLLAGGQALAVATGLASGETEAAGWPWVLVSASLAGYTLALVAIGIAGILLVRDLFGQDDKGSSPALPNA